MSNTNTNKIKKKEGHRNIAQKFIKKPLRIQANEDKFQKNKYDYDEQLSIGRGKHFHEKKTCFFLSSLECHSHKLSAFSMG